MIPSVKKNHKNTETYKLATLICLLKYLEEYILMSATNFEIYQINNMDHWIVLEIR